MKSSCELSLIEDLGNTRQTNPQFPGALRAQAPPGNMADG
jgi:hypothetical protein